MKSLSCAGPADAALNVLSHFRVEFYDFLSAWLEHPPEVCPGGEAKGRQAGRTAPLIADWPAKNTDSSRMSAPGPGA
ncbi:hypothetical protein GCM10010313_83600 [Streptomyces violarus]|nr:hypothetical protein GCM10010313_83600 [Streptomyces violarus]